MWRVHALAREAVRNVLSSSWRTLGIVLGLALIIGALATLDLRDAHEFKEFQRDFERSGAFVAIATFGGDAGPASSADCEGLRQLQGVIASGAQFSPHLTGLGSEPGVLFQRAMVTQGAFRVWDPAFKPVLADGQQFAVGSALASELGLRGGSFAVPSGNGPAMVSATVDGSARNPQIARWILEVTAPNGVPEQCWVEFEQKAFAAGLSALPSLLTTGDDPATAQPLFRPDQFTRDPAADFASRPQADGWPLASAMIVGLVILVTWSRRAETGLYLALGTPRAAIMFMAAVETGIVLAAAFCLAIAYSLAVDSALHHSPGWSEFLLAARTTTSATLLAFIIAPLAATVIVRESIADLLKDR